MYKHYYNIAGIKMLLEYDKPFDVSRFDNFTSEPFEDYDVHLRAKKSGYTNDGLKLNYRENSVLCWYSHENGDGRFEFGSANPSFNFQSACDFTPDWKEVTLYYDNENSLERYLAGPACEIIFRNALIHRGGMVIHAAAIEHEGEGIAFSAPSETGKTTQANLWIEHRGARDLNGDRPALIFDGDKLMCGGTAWSGSSNIFVNKIVPLKALVFVARAPENEAIRLSPQKAVDYLLPRSFLPYYDSKFMHTAMDIMDKIVSSGKVYLLKCRPDKEAVEVLDKCVKSV